MRNGRQDGYLSCKISRGIFTHDKAYRIKLSKDETYLGMAHHQYVFRADGQSVAEDELLGDEVIEGYVQTQIVGETENPNEVLVSVPPGEVIVVPRRKFIEELPRNRKDVSLQS